MKKIILFILMLPCFAMAQTVDLAEMGLDATLEVNNYFGTPELKKSEYGKNAEYKIKFEDNDINLMPCNKVVPASKMVAEVKKMTVKTPKGVSIKKVRLGATEGLMIVEREDKKRYMAYYVVKLKGKEYFAMMESETSQEDAEHLITIAKSIKAK